MLPFTKLGFEKGDERGIYISFYAGRIAWVYTTIVLIIWSWKDIISTGSLTIPFLIFSTSQAVFFFSYIIYKKKLGG